MMPPPESSPSWLALDIGGANLKAAQTAGPCRSLPFELWKQPEELPRALQGLAATFPPFDRLAITMTAELCDCYATKAEGVRSVIAAATSLVDERAIRIWGTDGRFHSVAAILQAPRLAAASNWLALATQAARLLPEGPGLLIDVGSTTTDLIPLRDGRPVPRGRTDTERLQSGELVYAGVRRTPVCALASSLPWHGQPTGLAAELFATTLDVYLTLGQLPPDPTNHATADGRPATVEAAHDRLARMVCADRDEFQDSDALELARAADAALLERLHQAAERACRDLGSPRGAVVAGSGAFLARGLAERIIEPGGQILSLQDAWGPAASHAGCAFALALLAAESEAETVAAGEPPA